MSGKRTRQQIDQTKPASLVYLSRVLMALDIPIREAEGWIRPVDLPEVAEELEERIRAVHEVFISYLRKHPEIPQKLESLLASELLEVRQELEFVVASELLDARKNLDLLDRLRTARNRLKPDFSVEAEELRKLRSGELQP